MSKILQFFFLKNSIKISNNGYQILIKQKLIHSLIQIIKMKHCSIILNLQTKTIMIDAYNNLRQKYITEGFQQAYQYILQLDQQNFYQEIVLTNFYCYITIQSEFKVDEVLSILNSCLQMEDQEGKIYGGSIRALTLYHIASVYFKTEKFKECIEKCRLVIQEFIGLYHSLDKRLQRKQNEEILRQDLQQILYYVFLMMAYVSKQENNMETSNIYADAGKRILKDRKDVMSLTSKTGTYSTPTKISCNSSQIGLQTPDVSSLKNKSSMDTAFGLKQRQDNCFSGKKGYCRSQTCKI